MWLVHWMGLLLLLLLVEVAGTWCIGEASRGYLEVLHTIALLQGRLSAKFVLDGGRDCHLSTRSSVISYT
jgi:hypothetical protein